MKAPVLLAEGGTHRLEATHRRSAALAHKVPRHSLPRGVRRLDLCERGGGGIDVGVDGLERLVAVVYRQPVSLAAFRVCTTTTSVRLSTTQADIFKSQVQSL